ncbi:MAG: hypothetical protein HY203_05270, partial [Nitrospirae bacterium]|nr:hypothetical protein [Nitrospirota bacterium]
MLRPYYKRNYRGYVMDTLQKLVILGEGAAQDHELSAGQSAPACFTPQRITDPYHRHRNPVMKGADRFLPARRGGPAARLPDGQGQAGLPGGIHVSPVGGGKTVRLLKVLQTNICEFDCFYCEHRASRDVP